MIKKITVGNKFPESVPFNDQIKVDIDDGGIFMPIFLRNPSEEEISAVKTGKFDLHISCVDDVIFFIVRFGKLQYMDAPYVVQLSTNLTKLEYPEDERGYALTIVLTDIVSKIVKCVRLIGLSTEISRVIWSYVNKQKSVDFNLSTYNSKINTIYQKYSTKDLLEIKIV